MFVSAVTESERRPEVEMELTGLWEDKVTKGVGSGQNQALARSQLQETTWLGFRISRYFPGDTLGGEERQGNETRRASSLSWPCDPAVFLISLQ